MTGNRRELACLINALATGVGAGYYAHDLNLGVAVTAAGVFLTSLVAMALEWRCP